MAISNVNHNARIIVVQKLYSYYINKDTLISYPIVTFVRGFTYDIELNVFRISISEPESLEDNLIKLLFLHSILCIIANIPSKGTFPDSQCVTNPLGNALIELL